jgi:hypothetical protein
LTKEIAATQKQSQDGVRSWIWLIISPMTWLGELSFIAWAMLVSYLVLAEGHLDWTGHAIGRDFINYWSAGHLVLSGQVKDIFVPKLFLAHEQALFDPRLPFHFWSYPPPTLFLVAPLGLTGYFTGFALWSLAGVIALYFALRLWPEPGWVRWMILLCPAVPTNIAMGQNGAFTAALTLGGLMLLQRRPAWGGGLFGLLVFKPQIGVLLPIAVLAGRYWKTLAFAIGVGAGLLALSLLVFGLDAWRGFFGPTLFTQGVMLRQGRGPFLWMMPSAYMTARAMLHLTWTQALWAQAPFAVLAVILAWRVCSRAEVSAEWKAATVMTATFLATPQAFNYDLIPIAAAAVLLLRRDPTLWISAPIAILAWALPVMMLGFQYLKVAPAPLILTALLLRLWFLADYKPSRLRSMSSGAQATSNT